MSGNLRFTLNIRQRWQCFRQCFATLEWKDGFAVKSLMERISLGGSSTGCKPKRDSRDCFWWKWENVGDKVAWDKKKKNRAIVLLLSYVVYSLLMKNTCKRLQNSRIHTNRNMGFFDYNHEQQREKRNQCIIKRKIFSSVNWKRIESITRYILILLIIWVRMENHGIKIIHNPMLSKMKNGQLPTHPLLHFLKHRIVLVSQRRLYKISRQDYSRRI